MRGPSISLKRDLRPGVHDITLQMRLPQIGKCRLLLAGCGNCVPHAMHTNTDSLLPVCFVTVRILSR